MANIHLKTAWDHIRRVPFQALAAFFVLTITFFVVTFLSVVVYASSQVLKYFETRPQVIAFLRSDSAEEASLLLQQKLGNDERVKEVRYVSKEEALEIYKKATADNPLLTELVSPAIFPASIEFSLKDLSFAQEVIDEVKKSEVVDSVGFTASLGGEDSLSDVLNRLRKVSWYIKIGGGAFSAFLVGTSFLVLFIIIGMRMTTRRGEIEILNLIGATPGFIRSPIILEALIYTTAGVLTGWVAAFILVLYSTPTLILYFGDIPILPKSALDLFTFFAIILACELSAGWFLALSGSILAVARAKKRK